MGSTSSRPDAERLTARTILFKSTGSVEPLRFRTFMAVRGELAALGLVVRTPDDHRSSFCRALSNVMARLLSVSGTSPLALGTRLPGADLPPTHEARGQTARFSPGAVCWQVFGLRELCRLSPGSYCPPLPVPKRASAPVEVVLAYRCGAAPELHRVPFSLGRGPGTNTAHNIRCTAAQCQARRPREERV